MLYCAGVRNCASMNPPPAPPFVKYFTINHERAYTQFVRRATVAYDAQLHEVTARLFSNVHLPVSFTECFHYVKYFTINAEKNHFKIHRKAQDERKRGGRYLGITRPCFAAPEPSCKATGAIQGSLSDFFFMQLVDRRTSYVVISYICSHTIGISAF
jgi:hypothetical protein